jgi:phosphoribosyl 1,2-cyclic phosphodiesterase
VRVTLWGTRGSVARAGPGTVRYGGDTACVEVVGSDGTVLIFDAGSGLLNAVPGLPPGTTRIDLLLTHLHMDHIQGLGFFHPLRSSEIDTHVWGPVSTTMGLAERLARYLSPPLFPVRLRELLTTWHDLGPETIEIGPFRVTSDLICHPGPTLGYRVEENGRKLVYIPDHEPALGHHRFPGDRRWTSGCGLASGADVLIHDAQYTDHEYAERVGWGHSTLAHAVAFATQAEVGRLVTFHHDPQHTDEMLDGLHREVAGLDVEVVAGTAGSTFEL